ncbi:hypothetical protein [Bradyrhizobium sp. CCBAU 51745]|uniref:hypothetical protein n=1 Tax=Bradyrhizobium sp. CCBAU 51745 TaxID=1325099 RepID=UPI00230554BB|nr:hypothetical protein [Bradyrhizobium sp. CCBAU 51745]
MPAANDAVIKAHRNNIFRYHRLLQTRLTDIERSYLRTRLAEEGSALLSKLEQGDRGECDEEFTC